MNESDKFLEYCGITAGETSLKKINHKLIIINKFFKKGTDNLKLEDLHSFLSWVNKSDYAKATKNDIIKTFKRFLKWKYKKDWITRFDEFKDVKLNSNEGRSLDKEDLLTADEMNLIIKNVEDIKYKTLLLLLQETACRPEEVLKNLKWKDVNLDKGEVKLYSSKTDKTRFIPIHKSKVHLKRYKEECFAVTPKANDLVFGMSNQAVSEFLRKIEDKAGLTKHLYPYLWRHSILSKMIKKLSPKIYEMYAGHSLETGMRIYAHLDNEDLREELFEKVYHIVEVTKQENERIFNLELNNTELWNHIKEIYDHLLKGKPLELKKLKQS
jgi:integrase